ncbi:hypothetical protein D3C81_1721240 [compost metagenome]
MGEPGCDPALPAAARDQTVKYVAGDKGFSQQVHIQRIQVVQVLRHRKPQGINPSIAADLRMMPEIGQKPAL